MNVRLKRIQTAIEPLRQEIINHKVYSEIKTLRDLKIFM
ncbi:MAG: heme oxygenase, partial [Pedobacter sp.]